MEESHQEELEVLLTKRLIEQVEAADEIGSVKLAQKEHASLERGESSAPLSENKTLESATDDDPEKQPVPIAADFALPTKFTKIEKSLASLGFFTPSSSRLKDQKVKRISFTREADGKRVEVTAEIIPSALFGLPITADQDKYLALQEIITNILQSEGKVENPIRFKSADLIRLMNRSTKTGKNFKEIGEWLDVMMSTSIFSQGTVYKAGNKQYAKDRFRVFDRAVSVGKELDDGSIADANYVWLSDWQLENINNKFLLPIDLETYRELKNHITKALVPLLQIWLFASHKKGVFEKRYDELCEILSLQTYRTPSQILRQLKPSLDELTQYEYLEKWRIEKTTDRKAYKILFFHGPKFHRDSRKRLEVKHQSKQPIVIAESDPIEIDLPEPGKLEPATTKEKKRGLISAQPGREAAHPNDPAGPDLQAEEATPAQTAASDRPDVMSKILDDLAARGLMPSATIKLLQSISPDRLEKIQDYIEYWDAAKATKKVEPGLLYNLIKNGDPLPVTFETSRQRAAHSVAQDRAHHLALAQQGLDMAYEEYRSDALDRYIAEEFPKEEYDRLYRLHKQGMGKQGSFFEKYQDSPRIETIVHGAVRAEIRTKLNVMPFEEFCRREAPRILADYGIDPAELGIIAVPASTESEPEPPRS